MKSEPRLSDEVIPQFVYGGGWKTTLTLVNMDETAVNLPINFYTETGEAWGVDLEGAGRASSFNIAIPSKNTVTISSTDGDGTVRQGWALLNTPCCPRLGGFAVFRQRVTGRPDFEAVIPLGYIYSTRSFLLFENTGGFQTGVAIVNPSRFSTATVTINIRDEQGARILLDQMTLRPLSKQVFSLSDRFPSTTGRRGSIELTSSPGNFTVLGLRFNPGGAFTSFHSLEP